MSSPKSYPVTKLIYVHSFMKYLIIWVKVPPPPPKKITKYYSHDVLVRDVVVEATHPQLLHVRQRLRVTGVSLKREGSFNRRKL